MIESQLYFGIMLVFDVVLVRKFFVQNSRKSVRKFIVRSCFPKLFRPKVFDFNVFNVDLYCSSGLFLPLQGLRLVHVSLAEFNCFLAT